MEKVVDEIYELIEQDGLMPVIKVLFGAGAQIELYFSENAYKTEIEKLDLSVRSLNCLKRAGLNTVEMVMDAMMENRLTEIRSLGKNSKAEIHVRTYEFGYESLSVEGKKAFVKTFLERNRDMFKGEGLWT